MPNHVRTVVKFSKLKPNDIDIILEMIATPICAPAPVTKAADYIIDFNKIIPELEFESDCPDEYKVNKDTRIELREDKPWFDWYKWHVDQWGTKWDAYDGYTKIGKSYVTFVFSTAWSVAYPVIQKLKLLGYNIDVRYADENYGVNCGRLKYTSEQGWTHWDESELKDPVRFARDLWNNY